MISHLTAKHLVNLLAKESRKPYRRHRKAGKVFETWDCVQAWGCCATVAVRRMKKLAEHGYLTIDTAHRPFTVTIP